MCTSPINLQLKEARPWETYKGIRSPGAFSVPCGKCAECLRARQNNIVARVLRELQKTPLACFVTLTYKPEMLPLAQSLWKRSKDTGEEIELSSPEICADNLRYDYIQEFYGTYKGAKIVEVPIYTMDFDDEFEYFVKITPSLYISDVQRCLKRIRKNANLPDFKYICVGEYGTHNTQRPHYHLIVFGLDYMQCQAFVGEWYFGFVNVKQIKFDGKYQSAIAVSKYVGKYAAKGRMDSFAVLTGCTIKTRICSSIGVGTEFTAKEFNWFTAQDVFKYDINSADTQLVEPYRSQVISRIVERLFVSLGRDKNGNEFKIPLPRGLVARIFQARKRKGFQDLPADFQRRSIFCEFSKEPIIFAPIWYMVTDFIRDRRLQEDAAIIQNFKTIYDTDSKGFLRAVVDFEASKSACLKDRNKAAEAALSRLYINSKI